MKVKMPDGSVIDTENEDQILEALRAAVAARNEVVELKELVQKVLAAAERPITVSIPDPDHSDIVAAILNLGSQLPKAGMLPAVNVAAPDNSGLEAALQDLRTRLDAGFGRVVEAQLADTMLVQDPITGDMTRSRKVSRGM
jgi:hypothetical protein